MAAVYNHENPEMLGMSSMMGDFAMSSLVDNIILMNWVETWGRVPARADRREDAGQSRPPVRPTSARSWTVKGMRVLPRQIPAPRRTRFPVQG